MEIKLLQISDFHYDPKYKKDGDENKLCHGSVPNINLGKYGNYHCDSPDVSI